MGDIFFFLHKYSCPFLASYFTIFYYLIKKVTQWYTAIYYNFFFSSLPLLLSKYYRKKNAKKKKNSQNYHFFYIINFNCVNVKENSNRDIYIPLHTKINYICYGAEKKGYTKVMQMFIFIRDKRH